MNFYSEPAYQHGTPAKVGVLWVNLGTPDAPTSQAVKKYLREFLSDPRVIEIPAWIWSIILNAFILPFRSKKTAAKYASIWKNALATTSIESGSPLRIYTQQQAKLLQGYLGERGHQVLVRYAMRYGQPSIASCLEELKKENCQYILVVPAYPQYCAATTASVFDAVSQFMQRTRQIPELRFIKHYHDHPSYINALATQLQKHWQRNQAAEKLVMSFHGMPKYTLLKGDPYFCECHKTARLLAEQLSLDEKRFVVTFQSRFGRAKWLQPYTEPTLEALAKQGVKSVDIICPGFTSDCLETLEEIAIEAKQTFLQAGGESFQYIPCLNESDEFIHAVTDIILPHLQAWPTQLNLVAQQKQMQELMQQKVAAMKLGGNECS